MSLDEIVKLIYKDTYNFYHKWKSISNPADWSTLMQDARELNEKYPYSLCQRILLELVEIIEDGFQKEAGAMTNADIIRQLPIEELAGVIMCPYGSDGINCIDNERGLSCIDCSLEWLRAERTDEDE